MSACSHTDKLSLSANTASSGAPALRAAHRSSLLALQGPCRPHRAAHRSSLQAAPRKSGRHAGPREALAFQAVGGEFSDSQESPPPWICSASPERREGAVPDACCCQERHAVTRGPA